MHYKQALFSLERSKKLAKKSSLYNKETSKRFKEIITKLKKGNLTKDEIIQPQIPESLKQELQMYDNEDVDAWIEGWKPESLAFRYLNILQMYKTKMDVRLIIITFFNIMRRHG